jgi:hypothetical protein
MNELAARRPPVVVARRRRCRDSTRGAPRNKGIRYPADPPSKQIVAVEIIATVHARRARR